MPIPMLPGLKAAPTVACWGSCRKAERILVGVLAMDAFETPREFVWNDAHLASDEGWIGDAVGLETTRALLQSISETLVESPILMIVRDETAEARAWERMRPLIPCAALSQTLGKESVRWLNAPPVSGSPADDLMERVDAEGWDRMLCSALQLLEREAKL